MSGRKAAFLAAAVALAALGAYIVANYTVRAESPGPQSESSLQVTIGRGASLGKLELVSQPAQVGTVALPKTENFEGSWPNGWQILTSDLTMYWGPNQCLAYAGSYDGWLASSGPAGHPSHTNYPTCTTAAYYPYNFLSVMVYGPFSTVGATSGSVQFKALYETEAGYDWGGVYAKVGTDCTVWDANYIGQRVSGHSVGWTDRSLDLGAFPGQGNLLGQANVCIAFFFSSDYSNTDVGFFLDNINISVGQGPTPTVPAGTPTRTPTPNTTPTRTPTPGFTGTPHPAPAASTWYFAEGMTGDGWLTFISMINPGDTPANVTATFNLEGGSPVVKSSVVPAHGRHTIWAHDPLYGPGPGWAFGVTLESDQPIVAQEALIQPAQGMAEGTIGVAGP